MPGPPEPQADRRFARDVAASDGDVPSLALTLVAIPSSVPVARRMVVSFAAAHRAGRELCSTIGLAVSEAVTNCVLHAYRGSVSPGRLDIAADIEGTTLEIVVADEGSGLVSGAPSPGLGLGLATIARSADGFAVTERSPSGLEVWMRFRLPAGGDAAGRRDGGPATR